MPFIFAQKTHSNKARQQKRDRTDIVKKGVQPISIIQPKLTIGQPNDRYEQEADRIADQVMRPEGSSLGVAMPESAVQAKPT